MMVEFEYIVYGTREDKLSFCLEINNQCCREERNHLSSGCTMSIAAPCMGHWNAFFLPNSSPISRTSHSKDDGVEKGGFVVRPKMDSWKVHDQSECGNCCTRYPSQSLCMISRPADGIVVCAPLNFIYFRAWDVFSSEVSSDEFAYSCHLHPLIMLLDCPLPNAAQLLISNANARRNTSLCCPSS